MDWKSLMFSFEGRINRKPYWMYFLAVIVTNIVVAGLAVMLGDTLGMVILVPYIVFLVWTAIAVQVKRWHDRDKSGWWVLINLIPFIGPIWVFVECGCLRGTEGSNSYGPDPLAGAA